MTADAARPADTGPAALAAELRVALDRTVRLMRRERRTDSVTPGQFAVLTALDNVTELTPRQLAVRENVQPPSMTRTLNALVRLGFVDRRTHPSDRRQVLVRLTEHGREELSETRRRRDAWLAARLEQLSVDERETMADGIALLRAMSEIGPLTELGPLTSSDRSPGCERSDWIADRV